LQGPFESQQEKDTIATKAREIAGKDTEHELCAEAIGNNEGTSGVLNADP